MHSLDIKRLSMATALGHEPVNLAYALMAQTPAFEHNPTFSREDSQGRWWPSYWSPVPAWQESSVAERLSAAILEQIGAVMPTVQGILEPWAMGVYVTLPRVFEHYPDIDLGAWKAELHQAASSLYGCQKLVFAASAGGKAWSMLVDEMTSERVKAVVFVAADSYVTPSYLRHLHTADQLRFPNSSMGMVPGEAAGSVLFTLSRNSIANETDELDAALSRMDTIARVHVWSHKSSVDMVDKMQALSLAPEQFGLSVGGGAALPQRVADWQTQWQAACQALSAEGSSDVAGLQSLWLASVLGEVGSAHLPLQLAAVLGWFELADTAASWAWLYEASMSLVVESLRVPVVKDDAPIVLQPFTVET